MPLKFETCNYCLMRYGAYTCRSQYCSEACRKAAARLRKRQADNPTTTTQYY